MTPSSIDEDAPIQSLYKGVPISTDIEIGIQRAVTRMRAQQGRHGGMKSVEVVQRPRNKEGLPLIAGIDNSIEVEEHHAIASIQINLLIEFTPNVYIAIVNSSHERLGWVSANLRHDKAGDRARLPVGQKSKSRPTERKDKTEKPILSCTKTVNEFPRNLWHEHFAKQTIDTCSFGN
jgi:hypothetical protein